MKDPGLMRLGEALVNIYEFKFWGSLWVAGPGPYTADTPCYVMREDETPPAPFDRYWCLVIVSDISDDFAAEAWADEHLHALIFERDCEPGNWLDKNKQMRQL